MNIGFINITQLNKKNVQARIKQKTIHQIIQKKLYLIYFIIYCKIL